jgi:L-2,4-diaminobutyrate decarboxylase
MFETDFLTKASQPRYRDLVSRAVETLLSAWPAGSYSGASPATIADLLAEPFLPNQAGSPAQAWGQVQQIVAQSVNLTHPNTIVHLHSPPLIASLAAEVVISALNQSMDSFDQGPAATMLELAMCRWLCKEVGLPECSGAVFTSGGSQSNFMGLLLARDACIASRWNWAAAERGLPREACRLRFLCSEVAHFTVEKAASHLGLGSQAVVRVAVDDSFQMRPDALSEQLRALRAKDLIPACIVATAGTTDFGSIDPLPEISAIAREAGAWLHVDAAYGSALLLSTQHRHLLDGLDKADSISVDFHKKFWQPISCAAFLVRDAGLFRHLEVHADYLNPESDESAGIPNLVNRSISTTRRFDALKLWLSFQLLGRERFADMIDRTIALAAHAAKQIAANPQLELFHQPRVSSVVFRYIPMNKGADADDLNARLRQHLLDSGIALIGHTRARGRQCLKFTCMNPMTTEGDLDALLDVIVSEATKLE